MSPRCWHIVPCFKVMIGSDSHSTVHPWQHELSMRGRSQQKRISGDRPSTLHGLSRKTDCTQFK